MEDGDTMSVTMGQNAVDWIVGPDTGASSKEIWGAMVGARLSIVRRVAHPRDPADLGRCLRLLERIPEWRGRISEMAELSPVWASLAQYWDELEAMFREDGDGTLDPPWDTEMNRTYYRLRYVIDQAQKETP
jgi:hypothetical protein